MNQGDRVRFLYGKETGIVLQVLKNGMIKVEMEIGLSVIVPQKELAIDFSSPSDFEKPIKTHPYYIQKIKAEKIKPPKVAVDLHVAPQKVIQLSNGEILDVQLSRLSTALNQALMDGTKELVIIHGVGTGTLKKAVHIFLNAHRLVKSIQKADSSKYGNGATKVLL